MAPTTQSKAPPPHRQTALHVWRKALAEPGRFFPPWYWAYLLLGLVASGLIPIVLPLAIAALSHDLSTVAYVMGVYNIGLLTSPVWGIVAERSRLYRSLFFVSFAISAAALAIFPFMGSVAGWMLAAFLFGVGTAGAGNLATLFIVDFTPRREWVTRIGLLQSINGAGQVVGLLLAGAFSHGQFDTALWLAALLLVPAMVLGRMGLPAGAIARDPGDHPHRLLDVRALSEIPRVTMLSGIGFHLHHLNMRGLSHVTEILGSPFGRFLLSFFLIELGMSGYGAYFALMLPKEYGLSTHLVSVIYATGAAIGIVLFVLSSRWAKRFGDVTVYRVATLIRFGAFVVLAAPYVLPTEPRWPFAAAGAMAIVLTWPLISVSGTAIAARLSPFSEGAAMGLYNVALALATVIGSFASGPLVATMGYPAIIGMSLIGLALAILAARNMSPAIDKP